jgi:polyhydroxyalkanoate synthesis regulator phasin
MAKNKKAKETTDGTLGRLSKAGEDAFTKLFDELGRNERVTDALSKAMSAKGKVDESAKRALGQVGLAAADELKDLRAHIARLEKRLAKLESEAKPAPKPAAKRRTTKPKTPTATPAEKPAEPKPPAADGGGPPAPAA